MGKKGREILGLRAEELLQELSRAYADEWLAHYYYLLAAHLVAGLQAPLLADRFKGMAGGELEHASKLAQRIIELGGEPPRRFGQVEELAHEGFRNVHLPEDVRDLNGFIRAALVAEREAIGVYFALVEKTRHADPVTHELAEEILADEVHEEEELENLLGE